MKLYPDDIRYRVIGIYYDAALNKHFTISYLFDQEAFLKFEESPEEVLEYSFDCCWEEYEDLFFDPASVAVHD